MSMLKWSLPVTLAGCAHSVTTQDETWTSAQPRALPEQSVSKSELESRAAACLAGSDPKGLAPAEVRYFMLQNMRGRLPAAVSFDGFVREPDTEAHAEDAIDEGLYQCIQKAGAYALEGPAGQPSTTAIRVKLDRPSPPNPGLPAGFVNSGSQVRVVETWIPWSVGNISLESEAFTEVLGDFDCGPPSPDRPQDDEVMLLVEVRPGKAAVVADSGIIHLGNPGSGDWHWLGSDRGYIPSLRCVGKRVTEWTPPEGMWGFLLLRARLDVLPGTSA